MNDVKSLEKQLGYQFRKTELLTAALSHRSVSGAANNERLEFLGDSVLNFIIAEALYCQRPKAAEGELSRLRSKLVKQEMLARLARSLYLSDFLRLGGGEVKTGGQHRDSILADAFEAIVAAIYLDSDFETCKIRVLYWYQNYLENLPVDTQLKDPKSRLQEYCQAYQYPLPEYTVLDITGADHDQKFNVSCQIHILNIYGIGIGSSRRRAEQAAAEQCLEQIYA